MTVTVYKLDHVGAVSVSYPAEVVAQVPGGVLLRARWERDTLDLGYTTFERGDHFREWYFGDRWFNIFEIRSEDGARLKGWYCNIAAPATISAHEVRCRDLLLDLWVTPDGRLLVLDQEEFASAKLPPAERNAATRALGVLRDLVARHGSPVPPLARDGAARDKSQART